MNPFMLPGTQRGRSRENGCHSARPARVGVNWSPLLFCILATAGAAPATAGTRLTAAPAFTPSIVNGTATSAYPTTGALLIYTDSTLAALDSFCSGTLIGCRSFLTAAHCVCPATDAAACQRQGVSPAATLQVFLQNGGILAVTHVEVDPTFVFGERGDLAILTLSAPVTGIAPSPINTLQAPARDTAGTVVGFGSTIAGRNTPDDAGIKREGAIVTGTCADDVPNDANVCWSFLGTGANTCEGDSGGPLFIDFGSGAVVAAVTSGGESASCQAPDLAFDTSVLAEAAWINGQLAAAASSMPCGDLPLVGDTSTSVRASAGQLGTAQPEARWDISVPAGTSTLRVALNGVPWSGAGEQVVNNFDLYVRAGGAPTTSHYDCRDDHPTPFGFCELRAPAAGSWSVLVKQVHGSGLFQLTATTFGQTTPGICSGDCNNDGAVTVDELITSIGIALGDTDLDVCRAGDLDGNGTIAIDELLTAVNRALIDCNAG
jgi:hypothetical protein